MMLLWLLELVKSKPHFVLTTNVDGRFAKAGFDAVRIFAVQGDHGKIQCATGCHETLYDDGAMVYRWLAKTLDCRIPQELVPKHPVCGGSMNVDLRHNEHFVEDDAWRDSAARYEVFIQ